MRAGSLPNEEHLLQALHNMERNMSLEEIIDMVMGRVPIQVSWQVVLTAAMSKL